MIYGCWLLISEELFTMEYSRWCLLMLISGLNAIKVTEAGCVEIISSDNGYIQCKTEMGLYIIQALRTNVVSALKQNSLQVLCSTDGRKQLTCLFKYDRQCPELFKEAIDSFTADLSGIDMKEAADSFRASLSDINTVDELEVMCTATNDDKNKSECHVHTCLQDISKLITTSSGHVPSPVTPFDNFQNMIGILCGKVKKLFGCLGRFASKCPVEHNLFKSQFLAKIQVNSDVASFEQLETFTTRQCPSMPKGFPSSKCVRETLDSQVFLECYGRVHTAYDREGSTTNCDLFRKGKACIMNHVGVKCGHDSGAMLVEGAHLFMKGLPTNVECGREPVFVNDGPSQQPLPTNNERGGKPVYILNEAPSQQAFAVTLNMKLLFILVVISCLIKRL